MPEVVVLLLAACGTALATGLGAIPVFFLGNRAAQLTPLLLGFAAGVMGVASIAGLLIPATEEGSTLAVLSGLAAGAGLLGIARSRLDPHTTFMGRSGPGASTSALVFLVLFVHSLPEGFAVGTAFASDRAGLSLFVILAIAIQNIPEGTSVAIPMAVAGFNRTRQFWAAVAKRPAAGRCVARLPPRRADSGVAPLLFCIRCRGDALVDSHRDAAEGLCEIDGPHRAECRHSCRQRPDVDAELPARRLTADRRHVLCVCLTSAALRRSAGSPTSPGRGKGALRLAARSRPQLGSSRRHRQQCQGAGVRKAP